MEIYQKMGIKLHYDPGIPFLSIFPQAQKHEFERIYAHLCSLQNIVQLTKYEYNQITKDGRMSQEILF